MQKAKTFDWKDSNMALFGSDLEKNIKKASAETEKAWENSGEKVGLQIWRIVKFKVTHWPKDDYGKFYDGDSYIVLNTYKEEGSNELEHDVHFWIGKRSTQDEYGTAAYKTVELDTFLDDKPIQHREVQGFESRLFKSYFKELTIMKGGADTGFRRVQPEVYKPRLFQVKGERKNVHVTQVSGKYPIPVGLRKANLTRDDVFILDLGLKIYQWNGRDANKDEKYKASQYMQGLKSERAGKPKVTILEDGSEGELYPYLNDKPKKSKDAAPAPINKKLMRLSDSGGRLKLDEVKSGVVSKGDFQKDDVYILDTAQEVFVWIGSGASIDERKQAMQNAHNFLQTTDHPYISVSVIAQGKENQHFNAAVAA